MLDRFRIRLSALGPFAVRLALGTVFVVHGWPKMQKLLAGENPVGALVGSWPMPQLWGWAAGLTEFVGGICLLVGLLTRFWAAGMVILMSVAVFAVHWPFGFSGKGGYEYPFSLGLASLALFLIGPGPISVDYAIGRLFRGNQANPVVGAIAWPTVDEAPVAPPVRPATPRTPTPPTAI